MKTVSIKPRVIHSPHSYTPPPNNGCSWTGYHYHVDGMPTAYARAITYDNDYSCGDVSVRMYYDIWYATYVFHPKTAYMDRTIPGPYINFHWSDHNADPYGSSPWVGFRLY